MPYAHFGIVQKGAKVPDTVSQLEVLVGGVDTKSLTVSTLNGETVTYLIEQFSTFKTAQILRMLAAVKDKVDLVGLLSELAVLTKTPPLLCPHCGVESVKDKSYIVLKDGRLGCNACLAPYRPDEAKRGVTAQAERVSAALSAIPALMGIAPDILLDFAALAVATNGELEAAYDEPNGIAKVLREKRKFLEFRCAPDVPIKILVAFFPAIGINFLLTELGKMDSLVANLLSPTSISS